MRIGYDSKRLFNNFTGLGNYSRTLLKNLNQYFPTHEYHLYTPNIQSNSETTYFLDPDKFHLHQPGNGNKMLWRSRNITKDIKEAEMDVFHGLSNELPVNIRQAGISSVVTIHDLIFKKLPETYPWIDRNIYDFKFRKACQLATKVVAISESTRQDIINYYHIDPKQIEVIYQSCSSNFYTLLTEAQLAELTESLQLPEEFMLYVGSVQPRKNLKLILEAMGMLQPKSYPTLVVVGNGKSYLQEMKQLALKLGIEKQIIWLQHLKDNQTLQALYQRARLFIYPSFYEGFGLPVVEAMLCRCPVITSNISSLPEAAGPHSILIDPTSPDDLVAGINKVLNDGALRKEIIEKSYGYAISNFSAEATSDKWMSLYQKIK